MTIADDLQAAEGFLLDAAPVEHAWLDDLVGDVMRATASMELGQLVSDVALAYARAASERAYQLGLELGKQAGRMTEAQP